MTPDEYCRAKAAASGSSFYYSFLFLEGDRKRAIMALYAFCREVDDAVDEPSDPSVARARIGWWRDEVARLRAGEPTHPVTIALEPHVARFEIDPSWLVELVDGMEMDLTQTRYVDFDGLALYCHRVAGVVGCAAARIFGATEADTTRYAERLGLAFQLTNIVRDVGDDARRERIYLPLDEMQRFGVSQYDILARRRSPAFVELMRFQAERARATYREAFALLPEVDRRAQRPGLMMAAIYSTLLAEIERDDFDVLDQRVSLTPVRKMWLAWKVWMTARPPALVAAR